MESEPPTERTRSSMPRRPKPGSAPSRPRPSSATVRLAASSASRTRTATRVAPECRRALVKPLLRRAVQGQQSRAGEPLLVTVDVQLDGEPPVQPRHQLAQRGAQREVPGVVQRADRLADLLQGVLGGQPGVGECLVRHGRIPLSKRFDLRQLHGDHGQMMAQAVVDVPGQTVDRLVDGRTGMGS
jgi:hypothetical protein